MDQKIPKTEPPFEISAVVQTKHNELTLLTGEYARKVLEEERGPALSDDPERQPIVLSLKGTVRKSAFDQLASFAPWMATEIRREDVRPARLDASLLQALCDDAAGVIEGLVEHLACLENGAADAGKQDELLARAREWLADRKEIDPEAP
jgi:hypothetical protein